MPTPPEIKRWILCGFPFQLTLIFSFMTQVVSNYYQQSTFPLWARITGCLGTLIVGHSMLRIYASRDPELMTDGLFRYTRHPMYTGFLMLGIEVWYPHHIDVVYWVTMILFVAGIFCAGFFQEKEVIARYGDEALTYYEKTPRLFLFYPFMKR